ncbi:MAG: ATP-binding cassette domain-containing protein [Bacteroidales bacterium]|nr:ATP-binding cassette domain-containing protein [Bacteroidales bacterium]
MDLFVAEHIEKNFANHRALDDVSVNISENSIFGLLGPNGAGKTTLIRIINQIIAPDKGALFFNGEPLQQKHVAQIGYLPEERGLYKKMKVGEQALYLAQLKGLSKDEAKKRLNLWFEKFDIASWWNRNVEELSKGMQQKVQFIVTILHQPKLLIFDEPFSGFDPINVDLLKNEILELKKIGTTIIFSTHNMSSVEELCDDILLINNSKAILSGKVKDIQRSFKKNIFELVYSGDSDFVLPNEFERISYEKDNFGETVMNVQLKSSESSNALLAFLLQQNIQIKSFKEILPTMNEIFIETVKH